MMLSMKDDCMLSRTKLWEVERRKEWDKDD